MKKHLNNLLLSLACLTAPTLALDTAVVFNEVQYHPASDNDASLEFIEIHNQQSVNIDLTGWRISGEVDFAFPAGTTILGDSYLVIAADPTALQAASGQSGFLGPFTGTLSNNGASLRIRNNNNRLLDEFKYDDRAPWPIAADGSGASLSKLSPQKGTQSPTNWSHSSRIGGTPGSANFPASPTAFQDLSINEVAGTADSSFFIELHNSGPSSLNISNLLLSFEDAGEYQIPPSTNLSAGAFFLIEAPALTLTTPPTDGENLYLYLPDKTHLIDALRLDDLPRARFPDGSPQLLTAGLPTEQSPGNANNITTSDAIVINEIMYHHRPQYAADGDPPVLTTVSALPWNSPWRFNQSGASLGSNWANTSHPISGNWESGTGPLGYDTSNGVPSEPIVTQLTNPRNNSPRVVTYYFETDFTINDPTEINALLFTHQTDDGAVFYLNGQEIHRYDMPSGAISASTLATNRNATEALTASFSAPPSALVAGENRLSVEVHQSSTGSTDIVMGLQLQIEKAIPGPNPPTPFLKNDEEWIELYNRSSSPVALDNWELDGAIDFTIPTGTTLAPGSYLIIARDLARFSEKFPGIPALGGYSGSLANSGEQLNLLDQWNNPADQVAYLDGAPWPAAADGNGSTLELRHPQLDNSAPSSWAASSNTSSSQWQTYTHTITAHTPTYRPATNNFHELRLGLLGSGELLLDDFSVIEDPNGSNLQLIANGDFNNSNGWRLLGTHQDSKIENNTLKVIATSGMNYLNNLIETNLTTSGTLRPVTPGTEYQISFRAKWLSGTPQLRFEFYYNKLAQIVILDQAQRHGTPGAQNSTYSEDIGPTLTHLLHQPAVPTSSQSTTITLQAHDPNGLGSLTLNYSINAGPFRSRTMTSSDGHNYRATIPAQANNAIVQFYVEARDQSGNTSHAPPRGAQSRALIKTSPPSTSGTKQSIRVNMLTAEANAMHVEQDILDNKRRGCTIIIDEKNIAYDSGIRLRGSMWSRRTDERVGFNLKLPKSHLFRGVHSSITVRNGRRREIALKHIINAAGGLHDNYNDIIQFHGHLSRYNSRARLETTRFGSNYLAGLPSGQGDQGTVFKMEGIRVFQETQDSTPNSPKLPFPIGWVANFDLADQGDIKEDYRHNLRINTGADRDDYSGIIDMAKLFSLSGTALQQAAPQVLNIDMWCRQFALLSLCGISDTYSQGNAHNLNFYTRPDGLVDPMPWDWDNNFNRSITAPLWGNRNISKLFSRPIYTRLYHGHLHDLITSTYNSSYLTPWFTHLGSCAGENFNSSLSYISSRGAYVLSQLPSQIPLTITSNGGNNFNHNSATVTLTGDAWINTKDIIIAGTNSPLPLRWLDADTWEIQVPLLPGENPLTISALDYKGQTASSANITITNTSSIQPAAANNLVITEIHYHPAGNEFEEFIELQNISTNTIDLSSITFTSGIDFRFPPGTILLPGQHILVVNDLPTFQAKYGSGLNIAGTFLADSKLSNKGETIRLESPSGSIIQEVTYRDDENWPTAADGAGPSLVLNDPAGNPSPSTASDWRASSAPGGSPGLSDPDPLSGFVGNPDADIDHDGFNAFTEYAMGTDDNIPGDATALITFAVQSSGNWEYTFPQSLAAGNITPIVQISSDLITWDPLTTAQASLTNTTIDGNKTFRTYTSLLSPEHTRLFLRVYYQSN